METDASGLKANGKIAFSSDRDGNREIYVMNPDGTNQVRVTNNPGVDDSPAWSPDGTKIAFVSQVGPDLSGRTIFMMNPDGSNKVEVTTVPNPEWWLPTTPLSWSPDGNQIAFIVYLSDAHRAAVNTGIFIVNIDGGTRRNITSDNPYLDGSPSWSPDGSTILFYSARGGPEDLSSLTAPNWRPCHILRLMAFRMTHLTGHRPAIK